MNILRYIVYPLLLLGILITMYAKGYNRGFDQGYDMAIAEVLLGDVNPRTYFQKFLKKKSP